MPSCYLDSVAKRKKYPVATPPSATKETKTKTLLLALGAVLVAAAVVVAIIVVMSSSGTSKINQNYPRVGSLSAPNALLAAPDVQHLLQGIPQSGVTLGNAKAPVTLRAFEDPQCPACQVFDTQVLPGLINTYVRSGKLRVDYYGVTFVGGVSGSSNDSERGLKAALAAGLQGKFWNYIELLYFSQGTENTGWLNDNMVISAASSIPGLNVPRLLSDRSSARVSAEVAKYEALRAKHHVTQTPTLMVGLSGGKLQTLKITSPADLVSVKQAIASLLKS